MADLFTPATRSSDPPTSREAAETVAPAVGTIREEVLAFAMERGSTGFVDDDLVRTFCRGEEKRPESSYRKRRSELAQEGWIIDVGEQRTNGFGNNEIVWRHRGFVEAPPPLRTRDPKERRKDIKGEGLEKALQLDQFARSLHNEGRAMLAQALKEAASIMRELCR